MLFRGSTHGWEAKTFHLKCDNKGATLTLIRSKKDMICGGFTSLAWDGMSKYRSDETAYLFSVDNKTKYMSNGT